MIAVNSGGSIRDAESLLDQVLTFSGALGEGKEIKTQDLKDLLGLVEINTISKLTDFLCQKKASEAVNFLNELIDKGSDLQELAKSLINYLRQALILKISGGEVANPINIGLTKEEFRRLQAQTLNFKEEELRRILNLFLEAENKMKYSSILQLPLELAIIESCGIT